MIWHDMTWYDMIYDMRAMVVGCVHAHLRACEQALGARFAHERLSYRIVWHDIWYDTIRYDMITSGTLHTFPKVNVASGRSNSTPQGLLTLLKCAFSQIKVSIALLMNSWSASLLCTPSYHYHIIMMILFILLQNMFIHIYPYGVPSGAHMGPRLLEGWGVEKCF